MVSSVKAWLRAREETESRVGVSVFEGVDEVAVFGRHAGEVAVGADPDAGQQEQVDLGSDGLPACCSRWCWAAA